MAALLFFVTVTVMCGGKSIELNDPSLPRAGHMMAVGHYNQSIYLMYDLFASVLEHQRMDKQCPSCCLLIISGGNWDNRKQLVKYDIVNGSFVDYGVEYLDDTFGISNGEYGDSIYYTQINETTLFTIPILSNNQNGDSLHVYNLQTLSFQELDTAIPIDVSQYGCIASSETPTPRLYITGGYNRGSLDDLQVVSLSDLEWLSNTPSMTETRWKHGCIVVNDMLWAIGSSLSNSVEIINITNIVADTWNVIGPVPGVDTISSMGVTSVDDVIFIFGGHTFPDLDILSSTYVDTVYAIDTTTYSIGIYGDRLPYQVNGMPVVAIGDTIYGFGGFSSNPFGWLDSWVSLDFLCELLFPECFSFRPTGEPTEFSGSVCGVTWSLFLNLNQFISL